MSNVTIAIIAVCGALLGGGAIWLMLHFATRSNGKLEKAQKDFGNDWGAHG